MSQRSNCLHNLCISKSSAHSQVVRRIINRGREGFGTHRLGLMGGSRVGIKSDTAGECFIILI